MMMAMYILMQYEKIDEKKFLKLIQVINPYLLVKPKEFVYEFLNEDCELVAEDYVTFDNDKKVIKIINEGLPIPKEKFKKYFKSGKSPEAVKVYREFYEALIDFNNNKGKDELEKLIEILGNKSKSSKIKKAFGFGKNIFEFDKNDMNNLEMFLELNKDSDILSNEDINKKLLIRFMKSKRHDVIMEYADVTKRVLKVTGVVSFKNGIVELKYRELWNELLKDINIEDFIFGKSTEKQYSDYEESSESFFLNHHCIEEIFGFDDENIEKAINEIKSNCDGLSEEEIREKYKNKISKEFEEFIIDEYPKEKVVEILELFSDRKNDDLIKKRVAENTDIPTIFEYIIGIAWYYISSEKYDVFSSFNLSMSADFEPETHAGGGTGDIVINYNDYILMIEATLMNKHAQKRGEWEPVLRHATNLSVDSAPKEVITLFIADELDENTINIWRAVATVPLKSSRNGEVTESVTIMPLKNDELSSMLQSEEEEKDKRLISNIKASFSALSKDFNMEWRDDILGLRKESSIDS